MATANKKKSEQQHTLIPLVKWINTEKPPLPHNNNLVGAVGVNNSSCTPPLQDFLWLRWRVTPPLALLVVVSQLPPPPPKPLSTLLL